jgi:hypothetical protein
LSGQLPDIFFLGKDGWTSDLLMVICYSYQHSSGQMRLRVTTLSRRWVAGPGSAQASSAALLYVKHCCSICFSWTS